ncbi:MAG: hypothetical protein M3Y39_02270 [Chloroflexota bacterium]|nr:hypothetical protein [Chloroflexota bacterium]
MDNYNNSLYPNPEGGKNRHRNFFQRNLVAVISAGVAVLAVLALLLVLLRPATPTNSSSGSSSRPMATTTPPTPTATTSGTATPTADSSATPTQASATTARTVLCQYDTTKGFNDWINSSQWKSISNGMLGSAGTDDGNDGSKYITWSGCSQFPTANYAVEAQMQYVRNANPYNNKNFEFGIMLRGDGTASGYEVGAGQDTCNDPTLAMISLVQDGQTGNPPQCSYGPAPLSGSGSSHGYKIDTDWHTYRAEVTGNIIRLFVDGNKLLETNDNTFTDAGQVGLRDVYGDINVKSFKVTSL